MNPACVGTSVWGDLALAAGIAIIATVAIVCLVWSGTGWWFRR